MRFLDILIITSLFSVSQSESVPLGRVILIRHGEKDAKGKSGDIHLNERGEIRAKALAEMFFPSHQSDTNDMELQFNGIASVVAQAATDRHPSRRKIETAQPIVKAGHITLKLFDHQDIKGTCEYIAAESKVGRTTLVVWDHTTISDLANELLSLPRGTIQWPMNRYDVIWELIPEDMRLRQYCQHLLFGDLWCPINPIQVFPYTDTYRRYMNGEKGFSPVLM